MSPAPSVLLEHCAATRQHQQRASPPTLPQWRQFASGSIPVVPALWFDGRPRYVVVGGPHPSEDTAATVRTLAREFLQAAPATRAGVPARPKSCPAESRPEKRARL